MSKFKDFLKKLFPDKAAEIDLVDDKEFLPTVVPPVTPPVPPVTPPATPVISADELQLLREENKVLMTKLTELTSLFDTEKKAREDALKNIHDKRIQDTLEAAVKSGKITQEGRETWKARLEKDFQESEKILNELPASAALQNDGNKKQENTNTQNAAVPRTSPVLDAIMTHNKNAMFTEN